MYEKKLTFTTIWNTFVGSIFLRGLTYLVIIAALWIFSDIVIKGAPVVFKTTAPFVNVDFLTRNPENLHVFTDAKGTKMALSAKEFQEYQAKVGDENIHGDNPIAYAGGGILGPLVGTILLIIVTMIIALFLGVASAVYLSEYSKPSLFISSIRLAIINLAGVPSVVFGMFGVALFVNFMPTLTDHPDFGSVLVIPLKFLGSAYSISFQGWKSCVLSGSCTLACMILPVIITASEECLRAVPQEFRSASLALGATQFQTIRKVVLPYSLSGILTSSIIGIARVAGETAPIMFTAAVASKDGMPWDGLNGNIFTRSLGVLFQNVQALPYHIYTVAAKIPDSEYSRRAQYGSVLVFTLLVMAFATTSIYLRAKLRAKYKW